MQHFRDLKVWGKAHTLTLAIYEISEVFPSAKRFGVTSQIRRAPELTTDN
jgi:four helix bundle protein